MGSPALAFGAAKLGRRGFLGVQGLSGDLDEDIVERGLLGLQALDRAAGTKGIEEGLIFTKAVEGELPGGAARLTSAHLTFAVLALEAVGRIDQRDLAVDDEGDGRTAGRRGSCCGW